MESIYPQDFFAIEHPTAPLVNIQFRTHLTDKNITNPDNWESITFNPATFFNDLTIEDKGGAQILNLNLFDKNYARLENIVVKSILAARLANKLIGEPDYHIGEGEGGKWFEFYISKSSAANIRIRFGYSQFGGNDNEYIDETTASSREWVDRIEKKSTVARSPWLYFQMSRANFKITKEGLRIEIKAFSVTGNFLDRARLIQKFAKYIGTPERIITQIGELVTAAAANAGDDVIFDFLGRKPEGYPTENLDSPDAKEIQTGVIEIMLGSEASVPRHIEEEDLYRSQRMYKTLKNILNEICSKVRPIIYDKDGNEIVQSDDASYDATGIDEDNKAIDKTANYSYVIVENEKQTVVLFYYQDPNDQFEKQTYARTYIWNETGHSIIKSLDIETKTDFAMLNLQIATIDTDNGDITLHIASGHDVEDFDENNENALENLENQENANDYTVGNLVNASAALESAEFNAMFVTNIRETSSFQASNELFGPNQAGALIARRIVSNINNQVFTGTMSLPGDPFYLFDSSIKPFSFLIQIIVRRPNYINNQNEFIDGGTSYVSGYYVIKKITHKISGSGFDTNLELMRWPRKN